MDVHTKEQRSYNMSQVKSENTKPELLIFKLLDSLGLKYEKHYRNIPGKPDIAFPEIKLAVFIEGEFWHGKGFELWKHNLSDFWLKKIGNNISRDRQNFRKLRKDGWHIIRIWGRKIVKYPNRASDRITRVVQKLS